MEQKDLWKDQIDQLGNVLVKILGDFLQLKLKGNVTQSIEISNVQLQSALDIDIEVLLRVRKEEVSEISKSRRINEGHLETLVEYFKEVGISTSKHNKFEAIPHLEKATEPKYC